MRPWTGGMVLILTCGVLPVPIRAQAEGDAEGRQQVGCFRGRPLPVCKSFWIFEMQGNAPLVQTDGLGERSSTTSWSGTWATWSTWIQRTRLAAWSRSVRATTRLLRG